MTRAPAEGGDKLKVAALDDTGPISYPLAQIPNNVSYETISEQPEVEPNQPLSVSLSFHGGMAYSTYDERVAGSFLNNGMLTQEPNIIRPRILSTTVTLTGAANPPNYYFETEVNDAGADDGQPVLYVIAVESAEVNIYKISLDSGDFGTLLVTKTFTPTGTFSNMSNAVAWNDGSNTKFYVGLGDNDNMERLTTIVSGTAADTWTSATDADARLLVQFGNRLARSTGNDIAILPKGSDPLTEANWGSDEQIGSKLYDISAIAELGVELWIGHEDGLFEYDTIGTAHNVLPEIGRGRLSKNCQGMIFWHGGFMIPADTGLWWTRTGEPVGPDSNPNNRGNDPSTGSASYLKHGRWWGLAAFGAYIYGLYVSSDGANAHLMMGRERDETDPPGWGPLVWQVLALPANDLSDFHGVFVAELSEFSSSQTRPTLWFANGNNVSYIWLDKDGAPLSRRGDIDLATAGEVISGKIDFGVPDVTKQLWAIEGWAEDFGSVTGNFQLYVYRDGGSAESVGSTITSDGFFRRFWTQDTNDTARVILANVTWVGSSSLTNTNGPHLRDVKIRTVALPRTSREWTVLFMVEDEQSKTAKKIRSELEGYVGDLKKFTLPDRDTFNGVMGKPRMLRADEISALTPRNQEPPKYIVSAPIREIAGT